MTPPGRELDALVAEHVMGWPPLSPNILHLLKEHEPGDLGKGLQCLICARPPRPGEKCLPPFSTDIGAAMEVWDKLREKWPDAEFRLVRVKWTEEWMFRIWDCDCPVDLEAFMGDTAPHAICEAALRAVGYKETP